MSPHKALLLGGPHDGMVMRVYPLPDEFVLAVAGDQVFTSIEEAPKPEDELTYTVVVYVHTRLAPWNSRYQIYVPR